MKSLIEISTHFGINLVGDYGQISNINDFINFVKISKDIEGFIIRFSNGHMLKIKTDEYIQYHKILGQITNEKDIWTLILENKLDDILPILDDETKFRLEQFNKDLYFEIENTAKNLEQVVITAKNNSHTKKSFALEVVPNQASNTKGLLFKIWDGHSAYDVVKNYIRDNLSTGPKLESVRDLANGIKWESY